MKTGIKRLLVLFCCLMVLFLSSCHRSPIVKVIPSQSPLEKKSPGKIVFDQEIHNFGTLKDGEIISYSFIFKNSGGSPFKIINVEKSCGCIDLHYSSAEVAPGETSAIELVLNTAGEWGNLLREATVETSQGEKKELKIGAYIENKQFNNNLNTQK